MSVAVLNVFRRCYFYAVFVAGNFTKTCKVCGKTILSV